MSTAIRTVDNRGFDALLAREAYLEEVIALLREDAKALREENRRLLAENSLLSADLSA